MAEKNIPEEEFSFRFWTWEVKCKKPGDNSIKILLIVAALIVSLTVIIRLT